MLLPRTNKKLTKLREFNRTFCSWGLWFPDAWRPSRWARPQRPLVPIYALGSVTLPSPPETTVTTGLGSIYTKHQRQRCNNSVMIPAILFSLKITVLLEKKVATPFWSDSIVFNENRIASIIAALMLTLGVNGPLTYINKKRKRTTRRLHMDSKELMFTSSNGENQKRKSL